MASDNRTSSSNQNQAAPRDINTVMENGEGQAALEAKQLEMDRNARIDVELSKNPDKMPKAIYYIVPNEFAERFCYYGINPLLNSFFKDFLKLGKDKAGFLRHIITAIAYATPLLGAAISDSMWGKYLTIIVLSLVYAFGVIWTSVFSIPSASFIGNPPALWGPLIGLLILALGTGGIKPCVSAHGGDQYLESQSSMLNNFYNYFYMSINAGSMVGNAVTPVIAELNCFGSEHDCYAGAIGLCAIIMILSVFIFWAGRKVYRIVPPTGTFVPLEIIKVNIKAAKRYWNATPREKAQVRSFLEFAKDDTDSEFLDEVRDFNQVLLILIPSPFFWMAFDQNSSTWQNLYERMNPYWFGNKLYISSEHTLLLNSGMILLLVPVFTHVVYPLVGKFYKFPLLDRMLVGMGLAAVSFLITGWLQDQIEANPNALILKEKENSDQPDEFICNKDDYSKCMNGEWIILPYFIITCGEILFSISGLNLTYQEVGKKTKASAASVWLLMVSIGNFLDAALFSLDTKLGPKNFLFLNAGLIAAAMLLYFVVRFFYTYREDRLPIIPHPVQPVIISKDKRSKEDIKAPVKAVTSG